ncbi:MAG TPA: hypothetical protein VE860_05225 [Chthoniobacterales bacterium]|nr:hypothetical protein [Chthoniobacterales bacterium]
MATAARIGEVPTARSSSLLGVICENLEGGSCLRVALFLPCTINAFEPEVGIAMLQLLERQRPAGLAAHGTSQPRGCRGEVDRGAPGSNPGQPRAACGRRVGPHWIDGRIPSAVVSVLRGVLA